MQAIGDKIRAIREARGLSVYQAARLAGIPTRHWYSFERYGRAPSFLQALDIAHALGCDCEDLAPELEDLP